MLAETLAELLILSPRQDSLPNREGAGVRRKDDVTPTPWQDQSCGRFCRKGAHPLPIWRPPRARRLHTLEGEGGP